MASVTIRLNVHLKMMSLMSDCCQCDLTPVIDRRLLLTIGVGVIGSFISPVPMFTATCHVHVHGT